MAAQQMGALGVGREPPPAGAPAADDPSSPVEARRCARPDCTSRARATLVFSYGDQRVVVAGLADEPRPQAYDLCPLHADRTSAPYGWQLRDERSEDERRMYHAPAVPADIGGDRTVEVLAAALRAVPAPPPGTGEEAGAASTGAGDAAADDPTDVIDDLIDAPDVTDAFDGVDASPPSGVTGASAHRREPRPVLAARARTGDDVGSGTPAAEW